MRSRLVHLLRHPAPVRSGLLLGHCDEPARDIACPALWERVAHLPLGSVTSSDLQRCARPASHLAQRKGLAFMPDARWRELDFGAWDGRAARDLPAEALACFWDDPEACPPPAGERWSALRRRVGAALADLGDGALVVTHGGAMRAAVSLLTGLDHRGVWAFDLPYSALLSLRIWPGEPQAGQIVGLATGQAR